MPIFAQPAIPGATLAQALDTSCLRLAWEHVQANDGAAGCDGVQLAQFAQHLDAELAALVADVRNHDYEPRPLLSVTIPKPGGGSRELAIPSVRDRVLQTAVVRVLQPSIDPFLCDASFAYRPGRSVPLALAEIEYWRDRGLRWVFETDIERFFDRIPHRPLLQTVWRWVADDGLCQLIELWIEAIVWRRPPVLLERGVPQGSPLSPLLANLYLHPFDLELQGLGYRHVRYADDLVVLSGSQEQAMQAWADVESALKRLGLALKVSKTRVVHFDEGFEFLGARLTGEQIVAVALQSQSHILPKARHRFTVRSWKTAGARTVDSVPGESDARSQFLQGSGNNPEPGDAACSFGQAELVRPSSAGRTLYIAGIGVQLRLGAGCIVLRQPAETDVEAPASVQLADVDQIVVYGNSMISTDLLRRCAQHGVAVHLLDAQGVHGATLEADPRRNQTAWLAQRAAMSEAGTQVCQCRYPPAAAEDRRQ